MSDMVISNLVGFILGTISSFFSWWILFHVLVPKVQFSNSICKSVADDEPSGWKYRFQFRNLGRRALVDVSVIARVSIQRQNEPRIWDNVTLAIDWSGDKKAEIPKMSINSSRAFRIFHNFSQGLQRNTIFPIELRNKASQGQLSLEDILTPAGRAFIKIYVAGYDELSGSRKAFESKKYELQDVVEGTFSFPSVIPLITSANSEDVVNGT